MRSIRRHLTQRLLAGIVVLVAACGVACTIVVQRTLKAQFDRALVDKAAAIGSLVEPELFGAVLTIADGAMPEFSRTERPEYFQPWYETGRELARSRSLSDRTLPRLAGPVEEPLVWDLTLPDGRPGRAAGIRVAIGASERVRIEDPAAFAEAGRRLGLSTGGSITVVTARDTLDLDTTLTSIVWGIVIAGTVLLSTTALLVRSVVASACRPVSMLADQIDQIGLGRVPAAVLDVECPMELEPFREGFQRFLCRIAESLEREKQLTARIAHELRTPVAELRTVTELARKWPDDEELRIKNVEDTYDIALQMERLLRTCLRMARLQSGESQVGTRQVDVSRLLSDLCRQAHGFSNPRKLRLERGIPAGCRAWTDPEILELILGNLLDNAFHHAPRGSWVRVAVEDAAHRIAISLTNPLESGLEVLPCETGGDPSDEVGMSDARHLGLGLATVTSAAEAIGAEIRIAVREAVFSVTLTLPRDVASDSGSPDSVSPITDSTGRVRDALRSRG